MRRTLAITMTALVAAGCGSNPPRDESLNPSAPPLAADLNRAAKDAAIDVAADPRSPSRVLAYVEGDIITYRDIVQLIGPELAQLDDPAEKVKREDQALISILRERMLFRAATDAGVHASRDEIDAERAEYEKSLARNGGTLEAYLHEHAMTRREFDETIRMQLIVSRYRRAAIGQDPTVRVRPVTDTYVPPEEVRKYYDRHPEQFQLPPSARVRMLTVKTDLDAPDREQAVAAARARAEELRARLVAGEDWVPVYRDQQKGPPDPDHPDGLEEIQRGKKIAWIEEFAFSAERGKLSDVIQQGTTFYILRGEGSHDARTVTYEEAMPKLRRMLSEIRARMAWIEVELSVLDDSTIQPEALKGRIRESLRQARTILLNSAGL